MLDPQLQQQILDFWQASVASKTCSGCGNSIDTPEICEVDSRFVSCACARCGNVVSLHDLDKLRERIAQSEPANV